ncbi:ABC transporter ATP-binding protein [Pimelobacter simplex]|uniref:ABC transporter ATP-binding protein n=1 Tax=Nocardioides simplex TaxID=2045 RepID=UPI003AAC3F90
MLTVTALRKVFPGARDSSTVAVAGLDLHLDRGECLAIVGESGSGKSTTARMIAGLLEPTAGQVVLDGHDVSRPARRRRERLRRARLLQMVFQDPYASLDPRQSPGDALAEVLALHGVRDRTERAARVRELGAAVGLSSRQLESRPAELSGGQRQRVALARALAPRPPVIILDEAVSALDVSIQAQVVNLLADVRAATGTAYLFITHDLAVVRQVADRVLVMKSGEVVEQGPVTQVLDRPSAPYTQRLRAAVPPRSDGAHPGTVPHQVERNTSPCESS